MKIKEIKTNGIGTVEGIVIALEEKANKNNSSFINMTVSDGETQVVAKVWNADLETFKFKTGQAVLVELKMEEYKGQKRCITSSIKPPEDAECMRQRSRRFLMTIKTI